MDVTTLQVRSYAQVCDALLLCHSAITAFWGRYLLREGSSTAQVNTSAVTGKSVHSVKPELSVKPARKQEESAILYFMACVVYHF